MELKEEFEFIKPKSREKIMTILEGKSLEYKFEEAIRNNVPWLIKQCIEEGFDPSYGDNYAIRLVSAYGRLDVLKELLKDKRVDPSIYDNWLIKTTLRYKQSGIVKLLLKDKRVKDKLTDEQIQQYETYTNRRN